MTHPDISIERLTTYSEADAADIGKLMHVLSEDLSDAPVEEGLLREIIDSPDRAQLVARKSGKIVASASMNLIKGTGAGRVSELEDFVTDPDEQRQGIGDMMWNEMVQWGTKRGATKFTFTSRASRPEAHSFYLNHGATIRETTVFVMPLK